MIKINKKIKWTIKSFTRYNECLLPIKSNHSSPKREVWQPKYHKKAIYIETFFRRSDFSLTKLRQWSKKWRVISISKPQLHISLRQSRKLSLNLWLWRWLKPRKNLVRFFITLAWKQLYVLLGKDLINFRILLLKILRLSEFQIDLSRFFHAIITDRKKSFWKKLCLKWKGGIFLGDLVLWEVIWRSSNS